MGHMRVVHGGWGVAHVGCVNAIIIPWLSHECPGYSTGVIRVLGHFDTRLSSSTHPHSTQHFNTSSTQATGTGWENTEHSSDGFLFARNKLILRR